MATEQHHLGLFNARDANEDDDAEYSHLAPTEEPENGREHELEPYSSQSSPVQRSSDERHVVFDEVEFMDRPEKGDGKEVNDVDWKKHDHEHNFRKSYHAQARSVRMYSTRHSYASDTSTLRDEPFSPRSPLSPRHSLEKPGSTSRRRRDRQHISRRGTTEEQEVDEDDEELLAEEESRHVSRLGYFIEMAIYFIEWGLVLLGYIQLVSGGVVYTGICRASYLNGCLAHLISE